MRSMIRESAVAATGDGGAPAEPDDDGFEADVPVDFFSDGGGKPAKEDGLAGTDITAADAGTGGRTGVSGWQEMPGAEG